MEFVSDKKLNENIVLCVRCIIIVRLPIDKPAMDSVITHDHVKDLCASEFDPLRIWAQEKFGNETYISVMYAYVCVINVV